MSSFQNVDIMYFIEKKVQYLLQRQQKNIIDSPTNVKEKGLKYSTAAAGQCVVLEGALPTRRLLYDGL